MNNTIAIILTTEIMLTGLIVWGLMFCSAKTKNLTQTILCVNNCMRKMLPTSRDIFKLTHEYIEMWKADFMKKFEATGNLLGEAVVYYLMHKIFKSHYDKFDAGFNLAKLFWS